MTKNFIYNIILFVDKLFIKIQYFLLVINTKKNKRYSLFNIGWGVLIQSIFYLNLINKNEKKIVILDYQKINTEIQNFTKKCKIKKVYSIFSIFRKDFSQYPIKYEKKLNQFCNKLFNGKFINIVDLVYSRNNNFYFNKILSKYIKEKISKKIIFFHSLKSLNDQNYFKKDKKFFYPNKNVVNNIKNNFGLSVNEIKNSINICIRKRNQNFKNNDRTNYLRDGKIENFKVIIDKLLKEYNYKIFITGDIDEVNINHKNLFCYKNFKKKISKNNYQLTIQTLANFHIMNSGGANQVMKFNNGKFLYIDCWPPINQTPNSIILYKNIFDKKNKKFVDCLNYLKMYEKDCLNQKIRNFEESKKISLKYFEAENYDITYNNKRQILESLDEFIKFISNNEKLNFKNISYKKLSNFYQKILIENKCLISAGNLR